MNKRWTWLIPAAFLFFPVCILLANSPQWAWPEADEFFWALKNSFLQAFLGTTLAMTAGLVMSFGLVKLEQNLNQTLSTVLKFLILWPSLLPSLFLLVSLLSLFPGFPIGLTGIYLAHFLTYAGVVAFFARNLILESLGLFETARILGASQALSAWHVLRSQAQRILGLSLYLFLSLFVCFSVPLALGGGKSTNLEILIYEKIHANFHSGEALALGMIQMGFLAGFAFLIERWGPLSDIKVGESVQRKSDLPLSWIPTLGVFFYVGFCFFCVLSVLWDSLHLHEDIPDLTRLSINTISLGLGVGILLYLTLFLLAWTWGLQSHKLLSSFTAPSTALLGSSVLLLHFQSEMTLIYFYLLLFVSLVLPAVYRSGAGQRLLGLSSQQKTAWQMGASGSFIFAKIVWPQARGSVAVAAGLGGLWATGDFTLIRMIFTRELTLAQAAQAQMASYQFNLSSGTMMVSLLCGFLVYLLIQGIDRVFSSELAKRFR
jgi:ABC-type Fe3+ transport system permease subunit